jgi:hypothetical protein
VAAVHAARDLWSIALPPKQPAAASPAVRCLAAGAAAGAAAAARAQASPGDTVIDCHWLSLLRNLHVILLSFLSFSATMTVSPRASAGPP